MGARTVCSVVYLGKFETKMASKIVLLLAIASVVQCKVYFQETFDDMSRWVNSKSKGADAGAMKLTAGKFYGDEKKDQGMQTSQDAKFYQISAKLEEPFSNEGKTLVLQFSVKHEQSIDCGGGYIKLFPSTLEPESMNGDSPYHVMFGPDICGPGTKRVHVIFTYKEKNHLIKKDIRCKDDELTHLYTLILKADNTYEVRIDGKKEESGDLEADWDMLPAKKIKDPQSKKPEDWDDEEDGEWEAPMINNPEYKGEWKPKKIDNPAYKGEWVHPEIDNPEYTPDPLMYKYDDIGAVGFEIWQVKSGTIFDNIIVTDDVAEAEQFAKETFEATKDGEKKMKDKIDEEERKKQEEEDKKPDEEEDADEEEEDDESKDEDKVEDDATKEDETTTEPKDKKPDEEEDADEEEE